MVVDRHMAMLMVVEHHMDRLVDILFDIHQVHLWVVVMMLMSHYHVQVIDDHVNMMMLLHEHHVDDLNLNDPLDHHDDHFDHYDHHDYHFIIPSSFHNISIMLMTREGEYV
jgi:hypothetical protein